MLVRRFVSVLAVILLLGSAAPSARAAAVLPVGLSAHGVSTEAGPRVRVEWDEVEGALGYDVFRRDGDGEYLRVCSTGRPLYEDAVILKDTAYRYRVRAVMADLSRTPLSAPVMGMYVSAASLQMEASVTVQSGGSVALDALNLQALSADGAPAADGEVTLELTGDAAVIEDGLIKAVKYGTAVLSATIPTGAFATCEINVAPSLHDPVEAFEDWALAAWHAPVRVSILKVSGTDRDFGTSRNGGARYHAGIDYYVRDGSGTAVYAMTDGKVMDIVSNFFGGTSAVIVRNADGSILLYGEIKPSVKVGDYVKGGRTKVGEMKRNSVNGGTMLHLELYRGLVSGCDVLTRDSSYSFVKDKTYNRRSDLMDPGFLLALN